DAPPRPQPETVWRLPGAQLRENSFDNGPPGRACSSRERPRPSGLLSARRAGCNPAKPVQKYPDVRWPSGNLVPPPAEAPLGVDVAADHLAHVPAGPELDLGRRARTAARLISRDLRSLSLRRVGANGLGESLDHPAVVR